METEMIAIYLLTSGYITIYVGQVLFHNGRPFLLSMLREEGITDSVNRILLTGYYLINLGYVCVLLTIHPPIYNAASFVTVLAFSISRIMLILGVMHYVNIAAVVLWNKFHFQHKS